MKITYPVDDPYGQVVSGFFYQQYPAAGGTCENVLDAIVTELIGTGQYRYGAKPNPESLVAIRQVARYWLAENRPVPILVPFGGMKTDSNMSIDVAELSTLKTLACLNKRVQQFYEPGLRFNVRIEDTGARWLFRDTPGFNYNAVARYTDDLARLIRILDYDFIQPVPESELVADQVYFEYCRQAVEPLYNYIMESDLSGAPDKNLESFKRLDNIGWTGEIPMAQRDYYRNRYAHLYPNIAGSAHEAYTKLLAEYFAGALARYQLGMRGDDLLWASQYLDLRLVPPVPGAPQTLVDRVLYYRAIPTRFTRDHIAPWRGKGYLRVADNVATPAIASWKTEQVYQPFAVEFHNDDESVEVRSDYVIRD